MRPLPLDFETRDVLAFIRSDEFPLSVYGRSAARAWPMVRDLVNERIHSFGVAVHEVNAYRRYVTELLRAFRTRTGSALADALELCLRKWTNLTLEPELLQLLLCYCHRKFHAVGHQVPGRKPPAPEARPTLRRRKKKSYSEALAKGRASRSRFATPEAQAESHEEGIARNRDISRRLAALLGARRVPGRQFIRYNAFAQKLGRLARTYEGESLQRAAADLVDYYEAKALDPDTLSAIAQTLFAIRTTL